MRKTGPRPNGPRPAPGPIREADASARPGGARSRPSDSEVRLPALPSTPRRAGHGPADPWLETIAARIGDPDLPLGGLPEPLLVRHLYARMARPGADRAAAIERLAGGLLELGPARTRRVLDRLFAVERWVDVLPLELADAVLGRDAAGVPGMERGGFIDNRSAVGSRMYETGETIELVVPLSARVRAFAPVGGARPDYVLCPGPPARYALELHEEGRFELLLLATIRGQALIDRLRVWVEDGPSHRA